MTAESLFTTQVPVITNANDGTPGIAGSTRLKFALPGNVTHVRFYATTTVSGTYVVEFWRMDVADSEPTPSGTLLASKTLSAPPVPGWNEIALDAPVPVDASHVYVTNFWSGAGRYVATTHLFDSVGITNGNIYAPFNGENVLTLGCRNGVFNIGAAPGVYPASGGNGTCYFADVVFVSSIPPSQGSANFDLQLQLAGAGLTPVPPPPTDPIATPVANALLACLTQQMNTLASPPAKIEIRAGAQAGPLIGENVDECCPGLAWVRVAGVYPSWNNFPAEDNDWLPCGPLAYAVILEMGTAFCMPWSDSEQAFDNMDPPSTQDWLTGHTTLMLHQTLMRRAAACCFPPTQRRAVGAWEPLSVEGGCMGGTLRVTVSVMAPCGDC